MDINNMIQTIREHPGADKIGMIASHLGVVRGTSRSGQGVTGIDVLYDHDMVRSIVRGMKQRPGIIEILVDTHEGHLKVGDEILAVAVGGDIRENVFPTLEETVNRIKAEASRKTEHFG
jgi:molybdopterin synthase catalytic subunit